MNSSDFYLSLAKLGREFSKSENRIEPLVAVAPHPSNGCAVVVSVFPDRAAADKAIAYQAGLLSVQPMRQDDEEDAA